MFTNLYQCPGRIARHESRPLYESRRRYLEHLAARGAALHTLRGAAGIIYRAAIWMKLDIPAFKYSSTRSAVTPWAL